MENNCKYIRVINRKISIHLEEKRTGKTTLRVESSATNLL